ncbi:helix-turn-helix domain-containing protein [Rhodococcus pyridinivorans]|uniref:TetR/AcrR family transcriptional regulator n=1 Tax=Rhodococcus pyridinivorans TaxID=103816 RepID=UPI00280B28F1|nr:helix-turn-helix domain-containing protein [Rhodococcus pyridinivorans]WMM74283.1 helix-turn-helix domain-containing protein [Rhodococcus pyridinivorans]
MIAAERRDGPRAAMIAGAIALMSERGVAATSFRDVLENSGAPRGSIYHHFASGKAQLVEETTDRATTRIERSLTADGVGAERAGRWRAWSSPPWRARWSRPRRNRSPAPLDAVVAELEVLLAPVVG